MCLNSRMPIPTPSAHTSVFIFLLNNAALAMDRSHARGSPRGKEAYYTHRRHDGNTISKYFPHTLNIKACP
jgi:hypothetical protein